MSLNQKYNEMAPTTQITREFLQNASRKVYTLKEACDLIEVLKTMPTGTDTNIQWIDVKTKKRVSIGSNQ